MGSEKLPAAMASWTEISHSHIDIIHVINKTRTKYIFFKSLTYLADGGEAALAGLEAGHGSAVVDRVERLVVVHHL